MIRNFLSSTATFSPPDDGGSAPVEGTEVIDTGGGDDAGGGEAPAAPEPAPAAAAPKEDHAKPRVESTTDSIKRAVAETKEKAEAAAKAKTTKAATSAKDKNSSQTDGAVAGDKEAKPNSEDGEKTETDPSPKATDGPPISWTAAEKQLW